MTERLIIKGDEIVGIAERVAQRLGTTPSEAVIGLLREAEVRSAAPAAPVTPAQTSDYDALRRLTKATAPHRRPGATSNHSDLYAEDGLAA